MPLSRLSLANWCPPLSLCSQAIAVLCPGCGRDGEGHLGDPLPRPTFVGPIPSEVSTLLHLLLRKSLFWHEVLLSPGVQGALRAKVVWRRFTSLFPCGVLGAYFYDCIESSPQRLGVGAVTPTHSWRSGAVEGNATRSRLFGWEVAELSLSSVLVALSLHSASSPREGQSLGCDQCQPHCPPIHSDKCDGDIWQGLPICAI